MSDKCGGEIFSGAECLDEWSQMRSHFACLQVFSLSQQLCVCLHIQNILRALPVYEVVF